MKAVVLSMVLLSLISPESIAQTDIIRPGVITKRITSGAATVDLDHVSRTIAYRALSLDSLCNMGLNRITYKDDTVGIAYLLSDMARSGELKLYYNFKEPSSELDLGDIERVKQDGTIKLDNLLIYEQWLLDYNTMQMVVKIIAIGPAYRLNEKEYQPLFWALYPHITNRAQGYKLHSRCDNKDLSLYDFFEKRAFTSELLDVQKKQSIR